MIKVTVDCDEDEGMDEGRFLLEMEKELRRMYPLLDVRVLKARMADDSKLRMARTA